MTRSLIQYSWPVSPYSAKTLAYLRWRGLPFREVRPSGIRLFGPIRRAVGSAVMPTVRLPSGEWLQDSSLIIDALDARFPGPSAHPLAHKQRIASALLELHGDEWLPIVALHYRWNHPKNRDFAITEFGRYSFPFLPGPLRTRLAAPIAKKMAGYRPLVGISESTIPGIERFTETLLDQLNTHLADHAFVLGNRPCMADFSLYGPIYAHLYRDPGTTQLFANLPNVVRWMNALGADGAERADGAGGNTHAASAPELLPDDDVPATLTPVLATIFREQMVYVGRLVSAIETWRTAHPEANRVPRSLGPTPFEIGGTSGERRLITYGQWMLQRVLRAYAATPESERDAVDTWLHEVGGEPAVTALQRELAAPFVLENFRMRLA